MENIYTSRNAVDGVDAIVFKGNSSFLVRLYDDDAKEFLPPFVWFDTEEKAKAYANQCAKHTAAKASRDLEHDDLVNYQLEPSDMPYMLDCYFDPYSFNLYHAYIGDEDISDLLRDSVIDGLQRDAAKLIKSERANNRMEAAIARAGL